MGSCFSSSDRRKYTFKTLDSFRRDSYVETKEDLPISYRTFLKLSTYPVKRDYKEQQTIGLGGFSEVKKCFHIATGQERAMKKIPKSKGNSFVHEMKIMRSLDCPYILKSLDFFEDRNSFYIITELCQSNLFNKIIGQMPESECTLYMYQILTALAHMHSLGIVHRDLKPENILIDRFGNIKICDFGSSDHIDNCNFEFFGTPNYISPDSKISYKSDIWSCGVILYVMFTRKAPYNSTDNNQILLEVKRNPLRPKPSDVSHISPLGRRFLWKLLSVAPERRLSAIQALKDPWLSAERSPVPQSIQVNLNIGENSSKLREAVNVFVAYQTGSEETIQEVSKLFQALDRNKDGKLSMMELEGYFDQDTFNSLDTDQSGYIDYSEFLRATLQDNRTASLNALKFAFSKFDLDGSGWITVEEIREVLDVGRITNKQVWNDILNEADANGDGKIDFNEFIDCISCN